MRYAYFYYISRKGRIIMLHPENGVISQAIYETFQMKKDIITIQLCQYEINSMVIVHFKFRKNCLFFRYKSHLSPT